MNPARTFGPAVWNNAYEAHWVYWVAPLLAAVLTSLTYKFVFRRELPKETPMEEEFPLKVAA
jgi:aquaporin rerated protein, invertebrate